MLMNEYCEVHGISATLIIKEHETSYLCEIGVLVVVLVYQVGLGTED